jgi:hypothetical protein
MDQMWKWLVNYERLRHSKRLNESWISTKYDFTDPNVRLEYVPEMNCNVGGCISALKKLWKSYKICGRTGETRSWQAWKITQIQKAMGLEESQFPELEGMQVEEEANQPTEEEESGFGTSEETSEYTDEWSEQDKQLPREEREAEDDWWFS